MNQHLYTSVQIRGGIVMYDEMKYSRLYHKMVLWVVIISIIILFTATIVITHIILGLPIKNVDSEIIVKTTVKILLVLLTNTVLLDALTIYFSKRYLLNNAINDIRQYRLDVLTHICRRKVLEDRIPSYEIEPGIGVVYFDINNFKLINDTYGHKKGDEILVLLANKIKTLRNNYKDIMDCYRMGGDEFVIVVKTTDESFFSDIVNEILQITKTIFINENEHLSISIGSVHETKNISMHRLIKEADERMYVYKKKIKSQKMLDS